MKEDILHNLEVIHDRIKKACEKAGRNRDEVRLLLATKTVSPTSIKIALENGQTLIAENKVQELKEKYEELKETPHENHFIGHLQTNKIKDILKYDVACVQSLDRMDLAEKLHQRLLAERKTIEVLIQVNTSNEESKFGVYPDEAAELTRKLSELSTLKIKGLMTIGLFSAETEKVRPCFRLLKNLQQEIIKQNIPHVEMKELSMGMSGDLETAIEEGATIVRVGTAVFGARVYPDSFYWDEGV
ncbi:YggS family pyridoxal phosphate-dependent enzyme [Chryseobacterium carnipullorum]|uniref:Pyridoxal phosphate homeostasis protein n=1 Tax=Chryseobacterium carnipullorum TaxID=1124835 RepID=A0A376DTD7_CHRCU|nr:YggS family pyridoxal phosphate-dependent enzyme [Chryseobacterium carnipullorum]AZA49705.1 YggS family pyridoxal phosphate-dependent enzyme [Chryseobacterium carnipullorum]AZA64596.1 YggS family pyridoxal phosphate-dependent enzyme [Chryseobacterium carnipullorum]STC95315.1 Predicted enzyme with a TIM-barrel fold [Chryseobacterium carnipullorum]